MNIFRAIRRLFGRTSGLRNKPGGMAWIKEYGREHGAHVMAGKAVKTVRVIDGDFWVIEPQQPYTVGPLGVRDDNGVTAFPGDRVIATAISDEMLEPWREVGDDEQDESRRYLPPVPTVTAPSPVVLA